MAECEHGRRDAHGEPGKDWCPGWLGSMAEPWREQIKFQMNITPLYDDRDALTRFATDAVEIDTVQVPDITLQPFGELRIGRLTEGELHTVQMLHDAFTVSQDSLANFKPLGWFGEFGERWYDVPIYNALVDEYGFDPLFRVDTADGAFAGSAPARER